MPQVPFRLRYHSYFYAWLVIAVIGMLRIGHAAEFFCSSGDTTCLIASINEANGLAGEHTITLEPGAYTLQTPSSVSSGLPVITGSIRIQPSAETPATLIVRDPAAAPFRIFAVALSGSLKLIGITIQRGEAFLLSGFGGGAAIANSGHITLENSSVIEAFGRRGAIYNRGTLEIFNSLIAHNGGGHDGGGIVNDGGNVLLESSTVAHNAGIGPGGISSLGGNLVIRNSSIVFNRTNCCEPGGGIGNFGGSAEVTNTTIANNQAGFGGGAGVWNRGVMTITNSTVRENHVVSSSLGNGGGIVNFSGGTVRLQNTIVAGNTVTSGAGPDCIGHVESLGNNLIGDPTACGIDLKPSDLIGDPGLGGLTGTGEEDLPGKTFYPVLASSPLINAANPSACPEKDQLGNPRIGRCDIGAVEFQDRMLVSIDVRPRSDANRINPGSNQKINVAILSINGFDSATVNPNTIRFGATGTEATPIHVGRRDVNGDGRVDQIVRFAIQDTGIECGDTSATLTGDIRDGSSIIGSSTITTTQCKKPKKKNFTSQVR